MPASAQLMRPEGEGIGSSTMVSRVAYHGIMKPRPGLSIIAQELISVMKGGGGPDGRDVGGSLGTLRRRFTSVHL